MVNPFIPVIQQILPEPEASLLAGMLFGVREELPVSFYSALIATGTVHVVALSGMNITIIVNVVAKTLFFLGRRLAALGSIVFILSFVVFVGPSPSVVRAALMGSLALIAGVFGRKDNALISLFTAGLAMLIFDLSLLSNLSFQLSFLATLSLILFGPRVTLIAEDSLSRGVINRLIFLFKESLLVSLAAQVLTLPILLFTFGRLSLVSPLANMLVGWTVPVITVGGMAMVIGGYFWLPMGLLGAWVVYPFLHYFVGVVAILASLPYANVSLK